MIKYYSRKQGETQLPGEALGLRFRMFPEAPFGTFDDDFVTARNRGDLDHHAPLAMYGPAAGFRPCGQDAFMLQGDYQIRTGPTYITGVLDGNTEDFGFYTGSRDDCFAIAAIQYRNDPARPVVNIAQRYMFAHLRPGLQNMGEAAARFQQHFGDSLGTTFAVIVNKDQASFNQILERMPWADQLLGLLCYRTNGSTFAMGISHGTMGWCGELTVGQSRELAS